MMVDVHDLTHGRSTRAQTLRRLGIPFIAEIVGADGDQ